MKFRTLFALGCIFFAMKSVPTYADDNYAHLKNPVSVSHEAYRAAKNMCMHSVYEHREQLGNHEAMRLVTLCSEGSFDRVISDLGVDLSKDTEVIVGTNGQELVSPWERQAREALTHIKVIEQHEETKEGSE